LKNRKEKLQLRKKEENKEEKKKSIKKSNVDGLLMKKTEEKSITIKKAMRK
jgi:hypothetical protein